MPRAALSDEQIRAFRERAVHAATRLFATRGYDAVTMRALAAELGVSPMTPYRYFEDKEDLFAMVSAEAFRRFADQQAAAAEAAGGDARAALRELGRAYIAFALAEPDAYRIMFELGRMTTRSYPALDAEQKRAFSFLLDAVRKAGADGDPLAAAHIAWARVHGLVSLHLAGKLNAGLDIHQLMEVMYPKEDLS